jgi:hypothetical protein
VLRLKEEEEKKKEKHETSLLPMEKAVVEELDPWMLYTRRSQTLRRHSDGTTRLA